MKRGTLLTFFLVTCFLLITPTVFADNVTENLQSRVLERFDSPTETGNYSYRQNHRWIVKGSKFVTQGFPKYGWIKTWPIALYPTAPKGVDLHSFGVEAKFDRMGYNYLEFIPVEDKNDANGNPVPMGIPIPGRVKNLDMWVWGSDYNYYMDVQLRDYQGIVHVLRLGNINFKGWKNLRVDIPSSIPQNVVYVPQRKGLELVKIVLWTRPNEKVDGFYVYLDEIKVFTDTFETPFDGQPLADPTIVNQLWSSGVDVSGSNSSTSSGNGSSTSNSTTTAPSTNSTNTGNGGGK
jgi:hypothetical protein